MRSRVLLCVLCVLFSLSGTVAAEPAVLVEKVPEWNVGDSWRFRVEKKLDRTVTQGVGMLQITMRLQKVESTMTFTVTGISDAEGEKCYTVSVSGSNRITGSYSAAQFQGETSGGELVQQAEVDGTEYRRMSDLAFVRADLRSRGSIQLSGMLGGLATPYESNEITIASPPAQLLKFPIVEGGKWRVSSTLTTTASGTAPGSAITTFNYDCEVLGLKTTTLKGGESYECVAISQRGTQTIQLQGSGINIEDVDGIMFFAPSIGNRVRDEAEGEELLEYVEGARPDEAATEPIVEPSERVVKPAEPAPEASVTH